MRALFVIAFTLASFGLAACPAPLYVTVINGSDEILDPVSMYDRSVRPGERRRLSITAGPLRFSLGRCDAAFTQWDVFKHYQNPERDVTVQVEDDMTAYVVPRDTQVPLSEEALAAIPEMMRITPSEKVCR